MHISRLEMSQVTREEVDTNIHPRDDLSLRFWSRSLDTCVQYVWVAVNGSLGQEAAFYLH